MSLVDRAKNIIVSPKTEWEVIANETPDTAGIFTGYVLPLAILAAIASFIGWGFVGMGPLSGITWGIAYAVITLLTSLVSVGVTAFVVNALAASFGSEKDLGRAMQLVAYGYTPAWIGGLLGVFPAIAWIGSLFGLYGIYLMYLGFLHNMKTPQDKVVIYMVVTFIILMVVYFVLAGILTSIMFSILGLSMFAAF